MSDKSNRKTQIFVSFLGGIFLIVAAVISSPHWFKHFFPDQYVEQETTAPTKKVKNESAEDKKQVDTGTENLEISKIELCPVNSSIPSYFLVEIKNNGTKVLENVTINLDLGRASFEEIAFLGNKIEAIDTIQKNNVYVTYSILNPNDSKTIYCLLTQPLFNSVKINGSNLKFSKEYTYEDLIDKMNKKEKTNLEGFYVFLQILIGFVLIVFSLYFVSVIYKLLRKKDLINWD